MKFPCPNCTQNLSASEDLYGTFLNCPKCEKTLKVPLPGMMEPDKEKPLSIHASRSSQTSDRPFQRKHRSLFEIIVIIALFLGIGVTTLVLLSGQKSQDTHEAKLAADGRSIKKQAIENERRERKKPLLQKKERQRAEAITRNEPKLVKAQWSDNSDFVLLAPDHRAFTKDFEVLTSRCENFKSALIGTETFARLKRKNSRSASQWEQIVLSATSYAYSELESLYREFANDKISRALIKDGIREIGLKLDKSARQFKAEIASVEAIPRRR